MTPELEGRTLKTVRGGSWVVISAVIGRVTIFITHTKGLITLLITSREPPSSFFGSSGRVPWAVHEGFITLGMQNLRLIAITM